MLAVPAKEMKRQIQTNARFFSSLLRPRDRRQKLRVLPRESQLHPVTDDPVHIDFVRAAEGARVWSRCRWCSATRPLRRA